MKSVISRAMWWMVAFFAPDCFVPKLPVQQTSAEHIIIGGPHGGPTNASRRKQPLGSAFGILKQILF